MIVFMQLPLLLLSLLRYLLGEKYPNPETKHHQMCYDEIKKKNSNYVTNILLLNFPSFLGRRQNGEI